jgi:ubiquitin carboxyl-terminal hydrolase 7
MAVASSVTDSINNRKSDRFEDAKEYYDFLVNKKAVKFHAHNSRCDPKEYPPFELVLNAKISYDQLSEKVGARLKVPPTHIRFYTINGTTGNPRGPVKRSAGATLASILHPSGYNSMNMNMRNDALYFEVLDISLAELDTKKNVKVTFLSEGITKEVRHGCDPISPTGSLSTSQEPFDILVSKSGNIEDLILALISKAKIADEAQGGKIRVYETNSFKFSRELSREYPVISINDYTRLIVERIPEDELDAEEGRFIQVFHFQNEPSRMHGIPFRFLLKDVGNHCS